MSGPEQEAIGFVGKLNNALIFPLIALLAAVAFFVFLLGCAEYIMNASNGSEREKGVKHITWGIIGLVIMMSAWAILQVASGTFGLTKQLDCAKNPSAGGCEDAFKVDYNEKPIQ